MVDHQEQFDKARNVLDVTEMDGWGVIMEDNISEVMRIEGQIKEETEKLQRGIEKGQHVDGEHYTRTIIALHSRLKGLFFINGLIDFYKKKKEESTKKLQT